MRNGSRTPVRPPAASPTARAAVATASERSRGDGGGGRARRRLAAGAATLAALALLGWALADPRFRAADGALAGGFVLPLGGAAALGALAAGIALGAARAGAWGGLAVLGQAAALQLVQAGHGVRYQHYPVAWPLTASWPLLLLALQLAAVAAGAAVYARGSLSFLHGSLGRARLAAAVVLCILVSAAPSADPRRYLAEMVFASVLQAAALANALLAVAALPDEVLARLRQAVDGLFGGRAGDEVAAAGPGGIDRFALACALGVAAGATVLTLLAYQRFPHVPDEVSYLLQARYFARGLLAMPAPPVPAAFNLDLMTYDPGRWYSPFPPGWPAVLALGVRLGVPWLVNPLLGGVAVLLAYLLLRELYPRRTARLGTLLFTASPWQLFLAMSLMSHTLALALALAAALGAARVRRGALPAWAGAGAAGLATGVVSLMRPLEGVALAGLLALWLLPVRGARFRFAPLAWLTLGALVAGAPALAYNAYLTGHALTFPVMAYFDRYYGPGVNALGFGANRGLDWQGLHPFRGHGPLGVAMNAAMNASAIDVELFGWAAGSLAFGAAFALSRRLAAADRAMLAAIAGIAGVHSFYWFSGGPDFGARYWFLAIVPAVALTARGVLWLDGAVRRRGTVLLAALLLSAMALVVFVPWRAADRYRGYRGMRPALAPLARQYGFGRSLVLVRGARHPDYAGAAVLNPIDLRAPVPVYAWDRGPAVRAALARAYPDRPVWIVDGPTVTGASYRVVAGPLPAGALLPAPAQPGRAR